MEKCDRPTKLGLGRCGRMVVVYRPYDPNIAAPPIAVCAAGHWRPLSPLEFEELFTRAMEGMYS